MECQYFESGTVVVQSDGSYSALRPEAHENIALSINTKIKSTCLGQKKKGNSPTFQIFTAHVCSNFG